MNVVKFISTAVVALAFSTAANAASYTYTEGIRDQVAGTDLINPDTDASNSPPGFFLGPVTGLNGGDNIDLHGRVVSRIDYYSFTSNRAFNVDFIFGGHDLEGGIAPTRGDDNTVSGLTARPISQTVPAALANFFLNGVGSAGNTFTANITSGDSTIFGRQAPGTYTLRIDGGLANPDVLYDIRIQAVPLPAGAVLLLTGLAGLGIARRRRG